MNKVKTHTLIVRGVSKKLKNKLKLIAGRHNKSVNGHILSILEQSIQVSRQEEEKHLVDEIVNRLK